MIIIFNIINYYLYNMNEIKFNFSNFDIKNYEKINQFNINFSCNNVENILSIFSIDNNKKLNHPLLLNGNYCLFCHEIKDKNIYYLKKKHREINLGNFLLKKEIKFRKTHKKEKIYKRQFIKSTEHKIALKKNKSNINNKNNIEIKKSESDTEEFFIKNKEINILENDSTKKITKKTKSTLTKSNLKNMMKETNIRNYSKKKILKTTKLNRTRFASSEIILNNNNDNISEETIESNYNMNISSKNESKTNKTSNNKRNKLFKHYSFLSPFKKINSFKKGNNNILNNNITNTNNNLICNICFDSMNNKYNLKCGHSYCKICIKNLILNSLENISLFNNIKCPNEFCQKKIENNIIEDLIDEKDYIKYLKFQKRIFSLSNNDKFIPCPFPDCDGYGEKIKIKKKYLQCEECKNYFCIECLKIIQKENKEKITNLKKSKNNKNKFSNYNILNNNNLNKNNNEISENENLEENEKLEIRISSIIHNCSLLKSINEKETEDYIFKNKNIKKCPNCNSYIEKTINNCNNMKCTNLWCNYEFCWICMKKYDNGHYKNPFNECFGLSQIDLNHNFQNYKGARILKCFFISSVILLIFFPMFVNFFSFCLIVLYLKFIDTNRKKIFIRNHFFQIFFKFLLYGFYGLISFSLISFGYLVLIFFIFLIPFFVIIYKCKNEDKYNY